MCGDDQLILPDNDDKTPPCVVFDLTLTGVRRGGEERRDREGKEKGKKEERRKQTNTNKRSLSKTGMK